MDTLWASFAADVARCPDTDKIIQIFEETMDELLASKS
jgi:hypothetical protein